MKFPEVLTILKDKSHSVDWCQKCLRETIKIAEEALIEEDISVLMQVTSSGVVGSILNAVDMHYEDEEIAAQFCRLVHVLSEFKTCLGKYGTCEAVLSVIDTHMGDPLVAEYGSKAIAALLSNCQDNTYRLAEAGGCHSVTQLGNFGFNIRSQNCMIVATNVCYAIASLCEAVNSTRLLDSGACALVIELAKLHMLNEEFAASAVKALCALASLNMVLREELGKIGACENLMGLITKHHDPSVLLDGCEAILHLSLYPSNTTMLGDCGACEVLVKALQNRLSHMGLGCEVTSGAMLNMATYGLAAKQNRFRLIDAGAVEALRLAQAKQDLSVKSREYVDKLVVLLLPRHYNLHRDRLLRQLDPPMLVEVLGYVGGDASMAAVAEAIQTNWGNREIANKETIRVLCTTATPGQGKTQLCCQLVRQADKLRPSGVQVLVILALSFNNRTTVDFEGSDRKQDTALAWRVLFALGNSYHDCHSYDGSLADLFDDIRAANCPAGGDPRSVGIFVLVDEVLKLASPTRPDYLSDMLDRLCTKQQLDISLGLPTFLMLTSLELVPVSHMLITKSGRVLTHIPVPYLADADLTAVADRLHSHFDTILCRGRSQREVSEFRGRCNLHTAIHVCVAVSGRHFRTLETALLTLYEKLVSTEQHQRAEEIGLPAAMFRPKQQSGYVRDMYSEGAEALDLSVRAVFDNSVQQIRTTGVQHDTYMEVMSLFLRLANEPGLLMDESRLYHLEKLKVVFIKARNPDAPAEVIPRASLPFLYSYPCADPRVCDGQPGSLLAEQIVQVMQKVGSALSRPFKELPEVFEEVVPYAELITVVARSRLERYRSGARVPIGEILPGVIVQPRGDDVLCVSRFVLSDKVIISGWASSVLVKASNQTAHLNAAAAQAVLKLSMQRGDTIFTTQPSDLKTQSIEYVSKLFSAGERQIYGLCSMKLRQGTNVVALARDMHAFAQTQLLDNCRLPERDYYVFIYCCACQSDIHRKVAELPPGTVVVTFECLRQLMLPFGLNPLVLEAERKWEKSKQSPAGNQ